MDNSDNSVYNIDDNNKQITDNDDKIAKEIDIKSEENNVQSPKMLYHRIGNSEEDSVNFTDILHKWSKNKGEKKVIGKNDSEIENMFEYYKVLAESNKKRRRIVPKRSSSVGSIGKMLELQ